MDFIKENKISSIDNNVKFVESKKLLFEEEKEESIPKSNIIFKIAKLASSSIFSNLIVYSLETINLIYASKFPSEINVSNKDLIDAI